MEPLSIIGAIALSICVWFISIIIYSVFMDTFFTKKMGLAGIVPIIIGIGVITILEFSLLIFWLGGQLI